MSQESAFGPVLINGGRSLIAWVAIVASFVAAVLHFAVVPMRFEESMGQGLFMVTIALLQLGWGVLFLRRATSASYITGIAIALGSVLVWVLATTIRAPFSPEAEAPSMFALITKAAEVVTLVALLLLPLLDSRTAQTTAKRVLPVVALAILLGFAGGGSAYGAGLVGEKLMPSWMAHEGGRGAGDHSDDGQNDVGMAGMSDEEMARMSSSNSTSNGEPGNSTGNQTANATNDPGEPSNPENCMAGMDMPGCTAAQAEARQRAKAEEEASRPADKALEPVKIALDALGEQIPGTATIDEAVTRLIVQVTLNATGPGPWMHSGPGGQGNLALTLTDAAGTETAVAMDETTLAVGVNPVTTVARVFNVVIEGPTRGALTITLAGQGENAELTVSILERFY